MGIKLERQIFRDGEPEVFKALILILDLEGWTSFFKGHPKEKAIVPLLNAAFHPIRICIDGGKPYFWNDEVYKTFKVAKNDGFVLKPFPEVTHYKFLGDGALYLWEYDKFSPETLLELVERFYGLRKSFYNTIDLELAKSKKHKIGNGNFPKRIRVGISAGEVLRTTYFREENDTREVKHEFLGNGINLAARLQSYCRELGFIVSESIGLDPEIMSKRGFQLLKAKKLRDFPGEKVFINHFDYEHLNDLLDYGDKKEDLFEALASI